MENKLKNISVISSNKILKSEKFNDFYFNSINPTNECKYVYIDANNLISSSELIIDNINLVENYNNEFLFNYIKLNGYFAFEIGDNQFLQIKKLLISSGFIVVSKYSLINNQIRCLLAKKIKNYTLQ